MLAYAAARPSAAAASDSSDTSITFSTVSSQLNTLRSLRRPSGALFRPQLPRSSQSISGVIPISKPRKAWPAIP